MTITERMARAICRQEHLLMYGHDVWRKGELERKVNQLWPQHVPAAHATLEAMREPTGGDLPGAPGAYP